MNGTAAGGARTSSGAPLGFWSVEVATGRVRLDRSMALLFGIGRREGQAGVAVDRLLPSIHPDDRHGSIASMEAAISQGTPFSYSYRLRRAGGRYGWLRALGHRFVDGRGEPAHVAGILLDGAAGRGASVDVKVIEVLMAAYDLARSGSDPMLPSLIEAVLLHAGRGLAEGLPPTRVN